MYLISSLDSKDISQHLKIQKYKHGNNSRQAWSMKIQTLTLIGKAYIHYNKYEFLWQKYSDKYKFYHYIYFICD